MNLSKNAFKVVFTAKMIILIIFLSSTAYAELRIDSVYPTLGELGKDLEVILTGSGFDMNTRVSMYLDSGNQRAIIGSVATPGYASGVTVVGTMACVADWGSGLQVIDVSTPASPQIIGSVDTPGQAWSVTVVGTAAYVADGQTGLVIVPVPTEIKSVTVNGATSISATLPSPIMAGHYTLRVFNETESDELVGAVSFTDDLQIFNSKAIIVAGGGPDAPGEIWEETKKSANKAYDVLVYEG